MSQNLIHQYLAELDRLERVIDLLARVTTVSVETQKTIAAMQDGPR